MLQDGLQGGAGQAPPLAAEMGHEARRQSAADAELALERDISVKKPSLAFPGEGEAEGEAFLVQPADGPADIRGGDAFDEVGAGVGGEVRLQRADRLDRQAGARSKEHVADLGEVGKHPGRGGERGLDESEAPPFAGETRDEADVGQVVQGVAEGVELGLRRAGIDVDHQRAAVHRPVPRQLRRAVQRRVAQHDDAHFDVRGGHAQFPFDIRPRTSNCLQLTYFSLQLHQRSRSRVMPSR